MSSLKRLWDIFTKWSTSEYRLMHQEPIRPAICFEFGKGKKGKPDLMNYRIALRAVHLYILGHWVYCQDGVLVSMEHYYNKEYQNWKRITLLGPRGSAHLTTREVAEQFTMHVEYGTEVFVLARRMQMLRCIWTMERIGYKVLPVPIDGPCDPNSSQIWTTTDVLYFPWEILSRLFMWYKGWV